MQKSISGSFEQSRDDSEKSLTYEVRDKEWEGSLSGNIVTVNFVV